MGLRQEAIEQKAEAFAKVRAQIYSGEIEPDEGLAKCSKTLEGLSTEDFIRVMGTTKRVYGNDEGQLPDQASNLRNGMLGFIDDDSFLYNTPQRPK